MDKQLAINKPLSLIACGCAICLVAGIVFLGRLYAENIEQKYVHALAPLHRPITINGSALQKTAFNNTDLLPVYGASEEYTENDQFQPDRFFRNHPIGFTPFEAALAGSSSLTEAEALASVGKSLIGKKVIISFTPSQFSETESAKAYDGLFTELHADELVFSPWLSYATKQLAAKRMQSYPETLQDNFLLAFALNQLSKNTAVSRVLYYATFPLGRLQASIMELQDHYQAVLYIRGQKLNPNGHHSPTTIDWQAKLTEAHNQAVQQSSSNPFGFSDAVWSSFQKKYQAKPDSVGDGQYIQDLKTSNEPADFALLLQVLKELGAKPMLVGRPMNDKYYNSIGISDNALNSYYTEIETIAARYKVPLNDFKDFQNDIYFGIDPASHTSPEGWIHVDSVYNNFYHETAY